jgi:hypothetical protein
MESGVTSRVRHLAICVAFAVLVTAPAFAQRGGRGQGGGGGASARESAPLDLTGQWVSLVTDDWRWRMMVPPKGDVLYLPVSDTGRRAAEQWDPAKDEANGEACRAYGAGGIMHMPGRLRISWENDNALKVETDTGQQTRLFNFGASQPASGEPTWQGYSVAAWELPGAAGGRGGRRGGGGGAGATGTPLRPGSSMRAVTTRMRPGYYRRNGVPYGATATLTEWFATITEPDGNTYLLVTNILEDAQYLNAPYVRTVQFKKQTDTSGWNPTPCVSGPAYSLR